MTLFKPAGIQPKIKKYITYSSHSGQGPGMVPGQTSVINTISFAIPPTGGKLKSHHIIPIDITSKTKTKKKILKIKPHKGGEFRYD